MAQFVSTTFSTRSYMLLYEYVNCSNVLIQSYGWRTVAGGVSGYYATEHRTKPTDLLSYPTSRPTATTERWSCGILQKHSSLVCSDGPHARTDYAAVTPWKFGFIPGSLAPSLATDLRLKIKEISYNMAETIGEYRETVDLVTSTGRQVFSEARRLYKRLPKRVKRRFSLLDIPATYLFSSFALVPTLATVHDACQALNASATQPLRRRVVVTRRATQTRFYQDALKLGEARCEEWESRRGIYYVTYDPASIAPLTAGNPAEALWAALPFSWVVDYFINVGSWLSSLDACKGVQAIRGTETLISGHRFSDYRVTTTATGWYVSRPGRGMRNCYTRIVQNSVPVDFHPEWRPSGSFRKLSYLLAIAAGFKR